MKLPTAARWLFLFICAAYLTLGYWNMFERLGWRDALALITLAAPGTVVILVLVRLLARIMVRP